MKVLIPYGSPNVTNPNYFVNRNWFGFVFNFSFKKMFCPGMILPGRFLIYLLPDSIISFKSLKVIIGKDISLFLDSNSLFVTIYETIE